MLKGYIHRRRGTVEKVISRAETWEEVGRVEEGGL